MNELYIKMSKYSYSFFDLYYIKCQLLRRKIWFKIDRLDRSFFIACLKFSKIRPITSKEVIETLNNVMRKILSIKEKIISFGKSMMQKILSSKIVDMFPSLFKLANDKNYIFWLGLRGI